MKVAIFKPGVWNSQKFTPQHLREMVDNFDKLKAGGIRVPVKRGHDAPDSDPAYGHVTALSLEDGTLFAELENVPPEMLDAIRQKRYTDVSIEAWYDCSKVAAGSVAPSAKGMALSGPALLGSAPPACKGLPELGAYLRDETPMFACSEIVWAEAALAGMPPTPAEQTAKLSERMAEVARAIRESRIDIKQLSRRADGILRATAVNHDQAHDVGPHVHTAIAHISALTQLAGGDATNPEHRQKAWDTYASMRPDLADALTPEERDIAINGQAENLGSDDDTLRVQDVGSGEPGDNSDVAPDSPLRVQPHGGEPRVRKGGQKAGTTTAQLTEFAEARGLKLTDDHERDEAARLFAAEHPDLVPVYGSAAVEAQILGDLGLFYKLRDLSAETGLNLSRTHDRAALEAKLYERERRTVKTARSFNEAVHAVARAVNKPLVSMSDQERRAAGNAVLAERPDLKASYGTARTDAPGVMTRAQAEKTFAEALDQRLVQTGGDPLNAADRRRCSLDILQARPELVRALGQSYGRKGK